MKVRIVTRFSKRLGKDVFYLDYRDPRGSRHTERVGTSPSLAERAAAKRLTEMEEERWFPKLKPITFRAFLKSHYLPKHVNHVKDPYKAKSILGVDLTPDGEEPKSERKDRTTLLSYFGPMRMSDISIKHVEAYQEKRRAEGVKASTINREIGKLRHAFNWAAARRLATTQAQPVARGVMLKEPAGRHPEILTPEQLAKLLSHLPEHLKPVALFAFHTGMRRGEILRLTWDRLDTKRGFMTLTGTKTGEDRTIAIPSVLVPVLRGLRERGMKAGRDVKAGPVFPSPVGGGIIKDFKHAWQSARKDAGLPSFRFHDLRHNFVSRALSAGAPSHVVRAISGHKTDSMLRRYSHATPGGVKDWTERIAAMEYGSEYDQDEAAEKW